MASMQTTRALDPTSLRPLSAAVAAATTGGLLLFWFPFLELALFARGAALLASLYAGTPVAPAADGWQLAFAELPVSVTAACSATDFCLMLSALIAWQLTRHGLPPARAIVLSLGTAVVLAVCVNSLRIVAVAQAHRWLIPRLPESWGPLAHLLTGAAVFLPSLIAISLLLEFHGHRRFLSRT